MCNNRIVKQQTRKMIRLKFCLGMEIPLLVSFQFHNCYQFIGHKLLKTKVSVKHIYFYFIIKLVTCFDPRGSSSGLHYEPICLKSCIHSWDPNQSLQILSMNWFVSNNLMEVKLILC